MVKKTVLLFSAIFLLFSLIPTSSATVENQGNTSIGDNINDNYITENEFENFRNSIIGWQENMLRLLKNKVSKEDLQELSQDLSNVSERLDNFKDSAVTEEELQNEISSLSDDINNQLSDISSDIQKLKQEGKGESLMLMAYGEEMKFLTFGGFGGSMNPMMLRMSGGNGFSSMFEMKEIKQDTPVLIMNNQMEMVNANVKAYVRGENGIQMMNIPTAGGMMFFPVGGRVFGTVSAPGYKDTSFFVNVGGTTSTGYSVTFPDGSFETGVSEVAKVTQGGSTLKLDSISVSGPKVVSSSPNPSQGYIRFKAAKEGSYTIRYTYNGNTYSETVYTENAYGGGGTGNLPTKGIGILLLIIAGFVALHYRDRIKRKVREFRGSSGGIKEEEDIWSE